MAINLEQIKAEKAKRKYSLDQIRAEKAKRGNVIPKSENILKRAANAYRTLAGPGLQFGGHGINTAAFGLPGAVMDKTLPSNVKEYLKPKGFAENVGAFAGDVGGMISGGPAMVGKKAVSKIANPLLRGVTRGGAEMASFIPANTIEGTTPGKEALKIGAGSITGGLSEGAPNMLFKGLFGKNISKARAESLGKEIEAIKSKVKSDPNSMVDPTNLIKKLEALYNSSAPEVQRKLPSLKRWIGDLKSSGGPVHADMIRQLESELGDQAKFTAQKGGFFQFITKPKSTEANKVLQQSRKEASDVYDVVAGPDFASKSKEVSGILKKYPDEDPSRILKSFTKRVLAGGAGTVMGGPIGGLTGLALESIAESPQARQSIFKFLTNPKSAKAGEAIARGVRGTAGSTIQKF